MRIPKLQSTVQCLEPARRGLRRTFVVLLLPLLAVPVLCQAPISWTAADRGAVADERYVGAPIDLSLRDADLVETLRTFSRIGGFNLLVQPGVSGSVTVELRGVPWDQALDAILKIHGLGLEVTGGTLRVASYETLEREARAGQLRGSGSLLEKQVVEGRLRHAKAERIAEVLRSGPYLSHYGKAAALDGNVLRVEERLGRVRRLARLVQALDDAEAARLADAALDQRAQETWDGLGPD